MPVLLTSFMKSNLCFGKRYSVARRQPKGFGYPTLDFLVPKTLNGDALLLRNLADPVVDYRKEYWKILRTHWPKVKDWLDSLDDKDLIGLCCWCPYSIASSSAITEHGSFICHTMVIGQMIRHFRPDITILLDKDREEKSTYRIQEVSNDRKEQK